MADGIPEQVYLDAGRAAAATWVDGPLAESTARDLAGMPAHRAAVASAYRAGQAAAPDGEDVVALGPGDYGKVHAEDIAMVARATGGRVRSAEVIPEYELDDVQAAPDGLSWSEAARLVTADAKRIEAKRIALADTEAAPDGPRTWALPDDRRRPGHPAVPAQPIEETP